MSSDSDFEDEFISILDARDGRPAVEAGAGADNADILAALEAVDLAWEAQLSAPSLEDDPTAVMLGLVPDPEVTFDSGAALAARKRSGQTVTELAAKLAARGWDVTSQDVFAWERGSVSISPALVRAVAEEIGAAPESLVRQVGIDPERERLRAIFKLPDFQRLASRWARIQGTTFSVALATLEARTVAAVHRGGAPEPQVVLQSLEALIDVLEGKSKSTDA
jgi:hypothetical protein